MENGSSASDSSILSLRSDTSLPKQLTMACADTASHEDTSIFITWRIDIFGNVFVLSNALHSRSMTLPCYCTFRILITHWSVGCKTEVVLGSKKTSWTFFRSETDGCAGQLLINGAIFLPSIRNVWWHLRTCSSNIWLSIQFFFCDLYRHGKFFMCLKQRVVLDLLIANISKFFSNCISRWHSGKVLLCYSFLQSIFDL